MTNTEIARLLGITRQAVSARLHSGWTREELLTRKPTPGQPIRGPRPTPKPGSIRAACAAAGLDASTYYTRRSRGMSHEEALSTPVRAEVGAAQRAALDAVGIARQTYYSRRKKGLSHEEALTKPRDARGRKRKVRP